MKIGRLKIISLIIFIMWFAVGNLIAADESEFYVKTITLIKVYPHKLGYRLVFIKDNYQLGVFYVPMTWFVDAGGKGEIVWERSRAVPYCSIFWKNDTFDHIRLYVDQDLKGPSWGDFPPNISDDVFSIDTLQIDFK